MNKNLDNSIKELNTLSERYVGQRVGPYYAWNKVSRTQVWQWCSAMGDTNPDYLSNTEHGDQVVAPPTMLQSWTFRDVHGNYAPGSTDKDTYEVLSKLDNLGFWGSVAVSYDQTYYAYAKEGDHIHSYSTISELSELKNTGLGLGCFVTETAEYFNQDGDLIGDAVITYLKYQPTEQAAQAANTPQKIERIRPVENTDSTHYWQGLRDGQLLLQQCSNCRTLRHPPQPMCERCQSIDWQTIESKRKGVIYSYTAIHYPEIPPFDYPNCIVLVDLDEGVRIAAQLSGVKPNRIQIGMSVVAEIEEVQEGLSLPIFRTLGSQP